MRIKKKLRHMTAYEIKMSFRELGLVDALGRVQHSVAGVSVFIVLVPTEGN
jgi:hypothetical protein